MRNPLAGYAVSVTGTLALLALVTGFVPGGSNQSLEPVTGATSRAKGENPLPRPLLHIPEQFREAMKQNLPSTPFAASGDRFPVLEVQSDGTVTMRPLHGSIPVKLETTSTSLAAMLTAVPTEPQQADFVPRAELFSNMPRINQAEPAHLDVLGKQLDFDDLPLRWNGSQQAFELAPEVLERTEKLLGDLRQLSGLTASMRRQAEQYRPVVEKYADRYNLSPDLVFAIIYTESDFDPDLISNRSAHAGGAGHGWRRSAPLARPHRQAIPFIASASRDEHQVRHSVHVSLAEPASERDRRSPIQGVLCHRRLQYRYRRHVADVRQVA